MTGLETARSIRELGNLFHLVGFDFMLLSLKPPHRPLHQPLNKQQPAAFPGSSINKRLRRVYRSNGL